MTDREKAALESEALWRNITIADLAFLDDLLPIGDQNYVESKQIKMFTSYSISEYRRTGYNPKEPSFKKLRRWFKRYEKRGYKPALRRRRHGARRRWVKW
ncbi:hypothetical protein [Chitinophaga sp. sic0106]|uniref:hypothetical protein n=1 Tax=Chitinophaga sp. sic0106 TaxID=2854785 RepID=UPI001C4930A7|nr:hypothetical protein [Chitinophaga sp. sic0106]MBV7531894.1 hypothetical protein [Chitinophaga sp. sic0106]